MTRELKMLLDRATERPLPFSPDPTKLIAAGRRRTRNRRIVGSIATVAAVAVVAAGVAVAVDLQDRRVAPATQPAPKPADTLCTTSTGRILHDAEVEGWEQMASVKDRNGTGWIMRKPDRTQFAYCVTGTRGVPNVPLAGRGGVLVRKSPLDEKSSLLTVFGVAHGATVRVLVQTGDGVSGDAILKGKLYIYRYVEPYPWPGPLPTVETKGLAANGYSTFLGHW
ncbi:hypothetical protein [Kribbella sp. NPDC055071]